MKIICAILSASNKYSVFNTTEWYWTQIPHLNKLPFDILNGGLEADRWASIFYNGMNVSQLRGAKLPRTSQLANKSWELISTVCKKNMQLTNVHHHARLITLVSRFSKATYLNSPISLWFWHEFRRNNKNRQFLVFILKQSRHTNMNE